METRKNLISNFESPHKKSYWELEEKKWEKIKGLSLL